MCCRGERIQPGLHLPESDVITDPGVGGLQGGHERVVLQVLLGVAYQPVREKLYLRTSCSEANAGFTMSAENNCGRIEKMSKG